MESPPKPFIIPVFLPHQGCPHRCIFCDQRAITGITAMPDNHTVLTQVDRFAAYNHRNRRPVQLSFYGGSFLGLPAGEMIRLLDLAEDLVRQGRINSIRFSTRPDTVTPERLETLAGYSVTTIELGVQSMDDAILAQARRGHTAAHTVQALNLLRDRGFQAGVQIMIGLPGDDGSSSLATAETLAARSPDFARIYPTIVIAGSPLARLFRRGEYRPLPLEEAVRQAASLRETFSRHGIPVIRMGL
ncbi:MAG: elongator complex protein 3, partial [Desulfosudaceae bacterium]